MSINAPAVTPADTAAIAAVMAELAARGDLAGLLDYQPHIGLPRHRAAAAAWLERSGVPADPDAVILTNGAQNAMALALQAAVRPGEVALAEQLTYPGFKALANLQEARCQGVAIDHHGIVPEARGQAQRMIEEASAYRDQVIAQGRKLSEALAGLNVTGSPGDLPGEEATIVMLIGALDRFLIAIVLLFFGYGIYTLFVRPDSTPSDLGLPRWLHVERIGQLKQTLAEVIIVVLFVLFLRVALETFVASDPDLSWLDAGKFLLLAWALKLAELHPKHANGERTLDGGRRERARTRDTVD